MDGARVEAILKVSKEDALKGVECKYRGDLYPKCEISPLNKSRRKCKIHLSDRYSNTPGLSKIPAPAGGPGSDITN